MRSCSRTRPFPIGAEIGHRGTEGRFVDTVGAKDLRLTFWY